MKKIIFILAILYSPSLFAATLTANTVPYVCQGGTSPQLCNSNIITDSSGNATSVLPTGTILAWAPTTLPAGFLWCNGQAVSRTTYAVLFTAIGATYGAGDGSTTFNLPDLMGRTMVGVDAMGGASATNRITQWSLLPAKMGGVFGEDVHRQTIDQMAPHQHANGYGEAFAPDAPFGVAAQYGNHNYGSSGTDQDNWEWNTDIKGGNGDGTGLGAPSNIVQPSIAIGYIIKN